MNLPVESIPTHVLEPGIPVKQQGLREGAFNFLGVFVVDDFTGLTVQRFFVDALEKLRSDQQQGQGIAGRGHVADQSVGNGIAGQFIETRQHHVFGPDQGPEKRGVAQGVMREFVAEDKLEHTGVAGGQGAKDDVIDKHDVMLGTFFDGERVLMIVLDDVDLRTFGEAEAFRHLAGNAINLRELIFVHLQRRAAQLGFHAFHAAEISGTGNDEGDEENAVSHKGQKQKEYRTENDEERPADETMETGSGDDVLFGINRSVHV